MDWKLLFNDIEPIIKKEQQEFWGDYTVTKYSKKWDKEVPLIIEVKGEPKPINTNDIFIETWSCRKTKNVGWIYKQEKADMLIFINNINTFIINYPKLREVWRKIYPNPLFLSHKQEYILMNYIANNYDWNFNRTRQINQSEGYYIPISWFIDEKLIIKMFKNI